MPPVDNDALLGGQARQALTFTRQRLTKVAVCAGEGCSPVGDQAGDFISSGPRDVQLLRSLCSVGDELATEGVEATLLRPDGADRLRIQRRDAADRIADLEHAADTLDRQDNTKVGGRRLPVRRRQAGASRRCAIR